MEAVALSENERSAKSLTTAIYALYAASFFVGGITAIAAIVINYLKKDDVAGTFLESHFRWQIRTFWFAVLWTVIGAALLLVVVGAVVLGITAVWVVYRIVKGFLRLNDNRPMHV